MRRSIALAAVAQCLCCGLDFAAMADDGLPHATRRLPAAETISVDEGRCELVVGAVSAWLLAAEIVSIREWLGGGLIMIAALIAIVQEDRQT